MVFTVGRFLSYLISGVCLCAAVFWLIRDGFSARIVLLLVAAILFYEYSDYLDAVRTKARQNRTSSPCIQCRGTGRWEKRRCPRCGGKGYLPPPKRESRPPVT